MLLLLILINFFNAPVSDDVEIKDVWMRPNGKGMATALYFKIYNNGSIVDSLYKVESDLAKKIEIHETYEAGDVIGMREVENIIINQQSSFELKPGSHHIMLLKLNRDVRIGDTAEFTLHFKNAGKINITAQAR